jgi:hypothetical protein
VETLGGPDAAVFSAAFSAPFWTFPPAFSATSPAFSIFSRVVSVMTGLCLPLLPGATREVACVRTTYIAASSPDGYLGSHTERDESRAGEMLVGKPPQERA